MLDDFNMGGVQDFAFGDQTSASTTTSKSKDADWGVVAVIALILTVLAFGYFKTPAAPKPKAA